MLKTCNYELWSISSTGKPLDFTRFVISLSLNWGLNASKASAKVSMSQEAKKQLMNVKRGSQFVLYWGYDKSTYNKVTLFWIGTSWDVSSGVTIELVHKSWELSRTPVRGVFTNTDSKKVAIKAAKDKGLKVSVEKTAPVNNTTIAVNQTVQDEFIKQFKGQVIKHGFDGKSLDIVSFENLKNKAQVYYISTEKGFINNMTISYKAVVPKDKSYIELIGGGATNSEPNNQPSKTTAPAQQDEPPLPAGTYALLLSTNSKNKLNNPVLELKLVVNGEQIGSYPCVSGTAYKRDSSKQNNVIPDGEYSIGSKLVPGFSAEIGGKFLEIIPKFKTSRSQLGIHLDPSYNKNNGEDGTRGCIGLTTAEDRNIVHKTILEKNIRLLVVNLKKASAPKTTPSNKKITSAYYVGNLINNSVLASDNTTEVFFSIASMFKLFVALAVLKQGIDFTKVPPGQSKTVRQLLTEMLGPSLNPPANVLIDEVGGVEALSTFCKTNGFVNSNILGLYQEGSGRITEKSSTVKDIFECFKDIFLGKDARYLEVQGMMSESLFAGSLKLSRQTHTKSGNNSEFEGAVSLVLGRSSTKYIVVVFAKTEKEKLSIAESIAPLLV